VGAHIIFILRTCAIWDNDKRIKLGLSCLLVVIVIPSGYFVNRYADGLSFQKISYPATSGYIVNNLDPLIYIPYVTFIFFETVVLILTLWRMKLQQIKSELHKLLYRDSLMFYLYLLSISLTNIILLTATSGIHRLLIVQLHRIIHSIVLSRIVLNIRSAIASEATGDQISTFMLGENSNHETGASNRWRMHQEGFLLE